MREGTESRAAGNRAGPQINTDSCDCSCLYNLLSMYEEFVSYQWLNNTISNFSFFICELYRHVQSTLILPVNKSVVPRHENNDDIVVNQSYIEHFNYLHSAAIQCIVIFSYFFLRCKLIDHITIYAVITWHHLSSLWDTELFQETFLLCQSKMIWFLIFCFDRKRLGYYILKNMILLHEKSLML